MSETTKHYQEAIVGFVAARGYRAGYTGAEFAVRQALKLAEETTEVVAAFGAALPAEVREAADVLGKAARRYFDAGFPHGYSAAAPTDDNLRAALAEADDVMVVLACLAEGAGDAVGERHDLMEGALAKARADVARGRRGA